MRFSSLQSSFRLVLTAALLWGTAAQAQPTVRTPLAAPLEMTGQTGGVEDASCGSIDPDAGQLIQVTEPFVALSFEVQSQGDYTLLIVGSNGFQECVFAHNHDGGVIQAPGLLNQGVYRVYVGDRRGESHPYRMSISHQ